MTLKRRFWTSAVRNPNVKVRYFTTLSLLIHIHRHVYAYFVYTQADCLHHHNASESTTDGRKFPMETISRLSFLRLNKYCILIVKYLRKEL